MLGQGLWRLGDCHGLDIEFWGRVDIQCSQISTGVSQSSWLSSPMLIRAEEDSQWRKNCLESSQERWLARQVWLVEKLGAYGLLVCIFVKHFAYSSACISLFPVRQYFLSANNRGQYFLGALQCFRDYSNPCANSLSPLIPSPSRPPRGNAVISVSQMKALMRREIKQQAQDHKVSS